MITTPAAAFSFPDLTPNRRCLLPTTILTTAHCSNNAAIKKVYDTVAIGTHANGRNIRAAEALGKARRPAVRRPHRLS
ncbi:MAG: hypothetical protein MZU97_15170 [Bacillus subtilis]|nr:hypothetical protein [Bacillus subtilis]